jgi:SMC interacting uncharacterized protein involved in chromosome segregation
MTDEEEEQEYISEEEIEAMITEKTSKLYEELAAIQEKADKILEQLKQHDRRIEKVEKKVEKHDSPMIEISADKVTEAIARIFVDRALAPVPTAPKSLTVKKKKNSS